VFGVEVAWIGEFLEPCSSRTSNKPDRPLAAAHPCRPALRKATGPVYRGILDFVRVRTFLIRTSELEFRAFVTSKQPPWPT
jgi:hypothetical protein